VLEAKTKRISSFSSSKKLDDIQECQQDLRPLLNFCSRHYGDTYATLLQNVYKDEQDLPEAASLLTEEECK